jgi:hypothetical protein
MCGETGEILVHHGARRTLAPLNILRPLTRLLDQGKVPYALAVNANELYKLGLADGPPALDFALGRESPALCLAGGAAGLAEDLGALLFDYARAVEPGTENPDYHYLIFSVAGRCFFVSEYATALIFIALASLFFFAALIYSVALRSRLAVQWKVFFGRSWILLLYWLMLVLALKAAALIFRGLTRGADPARFGGSALLFYAAAAAQLLLGAALFMLLSLPGDCIHVPRRANFYGSSAIVLAIAEILLAAYIDITFIPVFVWSFVFVFLAACVRKPALICVCALLTFLHGGAVLLTLVQAGNRRLGFLIFSGDTAFMIYAALVSLPFFMAVKRGALLFARKTGKGTLPGELAKRPPKPGAIVGLLAPRLAAIALAAAALGTGAWFVARNPVPGPPRRTLVDEPESAGILAMNVVDRIFLERRTLNITLEAPPDPLRFNLYVDGVRRGETPPVYSAPMPFRSIESPGAPGRHSVEFILGEGPPNPFSTEIVLPADFVGVLRAEALYAERGSEGQLGVIRRYPVGQAP